MVIDSSAIVAILKNEPEAKAFPAAIEADPIRLISAVSYLEAAVLMETRGGSDAKRDFEHLCRAMQLQITALDVEQADVARAAYRRYGKGIHSARLNLGDCCSYALSMVSGEPLLFKGGDFPQTDVNGVNLPPTPDSP